MVPIKKPNKIKKSWKRRNFDNPQYKEWRQTVYKRDNYRCQFPGCKYRGKKVEAHHIKTWASSPGLRFSKNNGITLCRSCHKKVTGKEKKYASLFYEILNLKNGL